MNAPSVGSAVVCRPFLGRERELAILAESHKAATQGRGGIVLISADAGVGKTRLVGEFRRLAGGRALIAQHACREYVRGAHLPFAAILTTFVAKMPAVANELPDDVALLRRLASGEPPKGDRPLERIDRLGALARIAEALAHRRALVAIVEDIHWADAATLELLEHLLTIIDHSRLLLIATFRRDELRRGRPLAPMVGRLVRNVAVREIELAPFDSETSERFVRAALVGHRTASAQIRAIAERSEGNAFFAEELARSSVEHGDHPHGALPLSIRSAILERLQPLNADDERILMHAAAIGRIFDARFLARTLARDLESVLPALRRARDLQLIVERDGDAPTFAFRHALVGQTLESELLATEQRLIHLRILDALEATADADPGSAAHHAWAAGDAPRTLRYGEAAGDHASLIAAFDDAARFYERALEAAGDVTERERLGRKIGVAWINAGFLERAVAVEKRVLAWLKERGDAHAAASLVATIGGHLYNSGHPDEALAMFRSELAAMSPELIASSGVRVIGGLAMTFALEGAPQEALEVLADVPPELWETGIWQRRAYRGARLTAFAQLADRRRWREEIAAHEAIARDDPDLVYAETVLVNVATTAMALGERAIAEHYTARGLTHAIEHRMHGLVVMHRGMRAYLLALHGELSAARAELERELGTPHDHFIARAYFTNAALYVGLRLTDDALIDRVIDAQLIEDLVADTVPPGYALVSGLVAPLLAARGRLGDARVLAGRTVARIGSAFEQFAQLLYVAEIGDEATIVRARALIAAAATHEGDVVMQATLPLFDALVAARGGRNGDAQRLAVSAVERFRQLGYPLYEARALELCGRGDEALAYYQRSGAVADLRRLGRAPSNRDASASTPTATVLSERERQVADLVANGRTNREIADTLIISIKTVEKHVASIYLKFGLHSRAQLAAFMSGPAANGTERSR
ncbi:MAG: AAA family ATPase [Candidatus Eremiobacteraeota bacterium]|nr:AAA family ATPase [Candidatus Eremiobacteraeota bacterium]